MPNDNSAFQPEGEPEATSIQIVAFQESFGNITVGARKLDQGRRQDATQYLDGFLSSGDSEQVVEAIIEMAINATGQLSLADVPPPTVSSSVSKRGLKLGEVSVNTDGSIRGFAPTDDTEFVILEKASGLPEAEADGE